MSASCRLLSALAFVTVLCGIAGSNAFADSCSRRFASLPIHPDFWSGDRFSHTTHLHTAEERDVHRLRVDGGRLQWRDGSLVHTQGEAEHFVVDPAGEVYMNNPKSPIPNLKHSSFLAGGDAAAAGAQVVEFGIPRAADSRSGHYAFIFETLASLNESYRHRGVPTEQIAYSDLIIREALEGFGEDITLDPQPLRQPGEAFERWHARETITRQLHAEYLAGVSPEERIAILRRDLEGHLPFDSVKAFRELWEGGKMSPREVAILLADDGIRWENRVSLLPWPYNPALVHQIGAEDWHRILIHHAKDFRSARDQNSGVIFHGLKQTWSFLRSSSQLLGPVRMKDILTQLRASVLEVRNYRAKTVNHWEGDVSKDLDRWLELIDEALVTTYRPDPSSAAPRT